MLAHKRIFDVLTKQEYFFRVAVFLLLCEFFFSVLIVEVVPYTEIDWKAYMQEVGGVINEKEYDYNNLKGDTGPLVYPAGFVWLYSGLYYLTDGGTDIRSAQYFFCMLYTSVLAVVFAVYYRSRAVPPWVLLLLCLSKRIHSIFVLRLFNDCFAMLFMYLCIYFMTRYYWWTACAFYSLALSIKMNVLLFAPALGLIMVKVLGWRRTIPRLFLCAMIQVCVATPFLEVNPVSYFHKSFEFGRAFMFKWSVNWQFLGEEIFLSKWFSGTLLVLHLVALFLFANWRWNIAERGLINVVILKSKYYQRNLVLPRESQFRLKPEHIISVMFGCNFIGIMFSRSLHYQFYVWYFHSLPYILFHDVTVLPSLFKVVLFLVIEVVWNIYPPNAISSAILFGAHLTVLLGLWSSRPPFKTWSNPPKIKSS
eukprot:TRINITY_DN4345_c0_g2_i1.p1 TRINITY_DN4345_c0_g2~~TRINITY_DN4345_c0_g2_i1.p1  ORF type:complete len:422 (+),score=25.32 TRINITY_DN4345_c0_g2_i1:26-1291(+)